MWTVPLVSSKVLGNHYGILSRAGKCFNLYCPGWICLSMETAPSHCAPGFL